MFQKSLSTDLPTDRTNAMNVFFIIITASKGIEVGGMSTESFPREEADKGERRRRHARLARLLKDFPRRRVSGE